MAAGLVGREPLFPLQNHSFRSSYTAVQSTDLCPLCNVSHLPPLCDHRLWQSQGEGPQLPHGLSHLRGSVEAVNQCETIQSSHFSPSIKFNDTSPTHDPSQGPTNGWTTHRRDGHSLASCQAQTGNLNVFESKQSPSLLSPFEYQPPLGERRQTAGHTLNTQRHMTYGCGSPFWSEYPERSSSLPHRRLSFMSFASLEADNPLSPQALLNGYHCDDIKPQYEDTCKKWVEDVEKARSDRSCHSEPNRRKSRLWLDLTEDPTVIEKFSEPKEQLKSSQKHSVLVEGTVGLTATAVTITPTADRPRMRLLRPRAATSPNVPTLQRPRPSSDFSRNIPLDADLSSTDEDQAGEVRRSDNDLPPTSDDTLYSEGLGIATTDAPSIPFSKIAREQEAFNRIKSRPTFKPDSRIRRTISRVNFKAAKTIWRKEPSQPVIRPDIPTEGLPAACDNYSSTTIDTSPSSSPSPPNYAKEEEEDEVLTSLESLLTNQPPSGCHIPFTPTLSLTHPVTTLIQSLYPCNGQPNRQPSSLAALHRIFTTSQNPHLVPLTDSLYATILALNHLDTLTTTTTPTLPHLHPFMLAHPHPRPQGKDVPAQIHRTDVPPKARAMLGMQQPPTSRPSLPSGWRLNQQRREWQRRVGRVKVWLEEEREELWGLLFADTGQGSGNGNGSGNVVVVDDWNAGRNGCNKARHILGRALGEVVRLGEGESRE